MTIPLIEGSDKIRAEKCLAAVKNILMQFDCEIIPQITITGLVLGCGYFIAAKPRTMPPGDPKQN